MASTKLRATILFLLSSCLIGMTPPSVAFGRDLDKQESLYGDSKPFFSLYTSAAEAKRLDELAANAELIALGSVGQERSFWREDAAIIETETVITLNQMIKGRAPMEIVVQTEGGFIAEENIGMIAPHEASFAVGETVLIFAYKQDASYRIADGAAGKFIVDERMMLGELPGAGDGRTITDIIAMTSASQPRSDRRWKIPDSTVEFKVNVNTAQAGGGDGAAAFQQAIINAAATWNQTPSANFTLDYAGTTQSTETGYNHVNEIVFMPKGVDNRGALAQVWFTNDGTIVEADIWVNDDFRWDAGSKLSPGEHPSDKVDLQSALLHEFGHWLILNHTNDPHSVMYPTLAPGVSRRHLTQRDIDGISAIYPCVQEPCVLDQ